MVASLERRGARRPGVKGYEGYFLLREGVTTKQNHGEGLGAPAFLGTFGALPKVPLVLSFQNSIELVQYRSNN